MGTAKPAVRVLARRDYAPETAALPSMFAGSFEMTGSPEDFVTMLWDQGARKVTLPGVVDVADQADARQTVQSIALVRELTARAVYVEWRLALSPAHRLSGVDLGHLQPPEQLSGTPDDAAALKVWRTDHYMDRHVWRRGPGFLQIRDRRYGDLRRFTVTDPAYIDAVYRLEAGCHEGDVPAAILEHLESELLVARVGEWVTLLAYRHRRWLQETIMI